MDPLLEKSFISSKDASKISGYSSDYLSRLTRSGKIKGSQIGRTWLVDKQSLFAFLEQQGKHKEELARNLARERAIEYRERSGRALRPQNVSLTELERAPMRTPAPRNIAPALRPIPMRVSMPMLRQTFALAATVVVLGSSAYASQSDFLRATTATFGSLALETAYGFGHIKNDFQTAADAKIARVTEAAERNSRSLAASIEQGTGEHLAVSIADHFVIAPIDTAVAEEAPAAPRFASAEIILPPESDSIGIGELALSVGVSVRDVARTAPKKVLEADLAFAAALVEASNAVMRGYESGVFAWVERSPELAEGTVIAILSTGEAAASVAAAAPAFAAESYDKAILAFVEGSHGIASAIVESEIAVGTSIYTASEATARLAITPFEQAGEPIYEAAMFPTEAAETVADVAGTVTDSTLGFAGRTAVLAGEAKGSLTAAAADTGDVAITAVVASGNPVYDAGQDAAVFTYTTVKNILNFGAYALAFLLDPYPPMAVAPEIIERIVVREAEPTVTYSQPTITNVTNETVVDGVSESFVREYVATALRSWKSPIIRSIHESTANLPDHLDAESLDVGGEGEIGDLTTSTTTVDTYLWVRGDALFDGAVNATNGITSGSAITAPYFEATSTTVASAFPYASTTMITSDLASTTDLNVSGATIFQSLTPSRLVALDGAGMLASVGALTSWISGTANQVTVTDDLDGTVTLSLPQDIHTAATPTFGGLTLSNLTDGRIPFATTGGALTDSGVFTYDPVEGRISVPLASTTAISALNSFSVGRTSTSTIQGDGNPSTIYGPLTLRGITGQGSTLVLQRGSNTEENSLEFNTELGATIARLFTDTTAGVLYMTGDLVPSANNAYDLGSPGNYWSNSYVNNLNVNTLAAANTTISGTQSDTFTINSDNATNDTEDQSLVFFRGIATPNAVFAWNSTLDRFELNQPTYTWNDSGTAAATTTTVRAVVGQTAPISVWENSDGNPLVMIGADGNLAIGTSSPTHLLTVGDHAYINADGDLSTDGEFSLGDGILVSDGVTVAVTSTLFSDALDINGAHTLDDDGSFSFGNGSINGDGSGPVGIGTSSPAVSLDVYGVDAIRLPVGTTAQRPAGDTGYVRFNTTTHQFEGYGDNGVWQGLGGVVDADQDTYVTADTNNTDEDALRFFTAGSERMTIRPNGNVGIGTIIPTNDLDVSGAVAIGATFAANATAAPTNGLAVEGNVGIGTLSPFNKLDVKGGAVIGNTYAGASTAPSNGLLVEGNVGIGTTTPYAQLALGGGNLVLGAASAGGTPGDLYLPKLAAAAGAALAVDPTGKVIATSTASIGVGTTGQLPYYAANGTALTATSSIYLATSGNVGIGMTTPGYKLDVQGGTLRIGDSSADSRLRIEGNQPYLIGMRNTSGGTYAWMGVTTAGAYQFSDQGGTALATILQGGNVGIGTTSPLANLVVSADKTYGSGPGAAQLLLSGTTDPLKQLFVGIDTTSNYAFLQATRYGISTYPLALNPSGGNVGIGTTSPSRLFSVAGSAYLAPGTSDLVQVGSRIKLQDDGNAHIHSTSEPLWINAEDGSPVYINNQYNGDVILTNGTGNVGIGTAAPVSKLDVVTGIGDGTTNEANSFRLRSGSTAGNAMLLQMGVSTTAIGGLNQGYGYIGATYWGGGEDNPLVLQPKGGIVGVGTLANLSGYLTQSDNNAFAVGGNMAVNGNVGIGTTSPYAKLSVAGDIVTNQYLNIHSWQGTTYGTGTGSIWYDGVGGSGDATGYMSFGHDGGTSMVLQRGGNVGIGTTNPTAQLQLNDGNVTNATNKGIAIYGGGTNQAVGTEFTHMFFGNRTDSSSAGAKIGVLTGSVSGASNTGTQIAFSTSLSSSLVERMRIDSNGNVGIGTSTMLAKLHVDAGTTGGVSDIMGYLYGATGTGTFTARNGATRGMATLVVGNQYNTNAGAVFNAYTGSIDGALYVSASGHVGIGTTTPNYKFTLTPGTDSVGLHMPPATGADSGLYVTSWAANDTIIGSGANYSTGAWRAKSTTASIMEMYNGGIYFYGNTGLTAGNTFSPTTIMSIGSTGAVSSPNGFYASGTGAPFMQIYDTAPTGAAMMMMMRNLGYNTYLQIIGDGTAEFGANLFTAYVRQGNHGTTCSFGAGAWSCTSDGRLKENINTLDPTDGLSAINQLRPVTYALKKDSEHKTQLGFIAQEVMEIFPEAVSFNTAATSTENLDGTYQLEHSALIGPAILAIQQLDARTRFIASDSLSTSTALNVSSLGNVGVGTTTDAYKFAVGGDIAATGFVNVSTETSKTGINYLTASTTEEILMEIGSVQIAEYRYKTEPRKNPMRLGLIAENAPSLVLSADGKGVDIYKLTTFTLAGVQALATKVDAQTARLNSLEQRLQMLEEGAIATGTFEFSTTTLKSALADLGVLLENGVLRLNTLVARQFVAVADEDGEGSAGQGIILEGNKVFEVENKYVHETSKIFVTFTSPVEGSWYVTNKEEGSFRIALSKNQDEDVAFDYFIVQTEGDFDTSVSEEAPEEEEEDPAEEEEPADEEPVQDEEISKDAPEVTLKGPAAVEVEQGGDYNDEGATASDPQEGDLSDRIEIRGSVDTNIPGLYTLTYSATDAQGHTGNASRVITVIEADKEEEALEELSEEEEQAPVETPEAFLPAEDAEESPQEGSADTDEEPSTTASTNEQAPAEPAN